MTMGAKDRALLLARRILSGRDFSNAHSNAADLCHRVMLENQIDHERWTQKDLSPKAARLEGGISSQSLQLLLLLLHDLTRVVTDLHRFLLLKNGALGSGCL